MPRSNEQGNTATPDASSGDRKGYRHFGDGIAGEIIAARLQGFSSTDLDYRDIAVDSNGQVLTVGGGGGGGGGGPATIADGADVAQGTTTDPSSSNTVIGLLKAIKAAITGTLSVSGPVTDTQLRASAVPVSLASVPSHAVTTVDGGSATIGTTTDTAAASTLVGLLKKLVSLLPSALVGGRLDVNIGASGATVAVSGPLTDTQLRASAVPVSGALTDTQLRATAVPVSGPLTDTQIRATALPVSGPLTDTQLRATRVPVDGSGVTQPVSGPLTDTQLRATRVPVDGSGVTQPVSGPLTDTQLRATRVPVIDQHDVARTQKAYKFRSTVAPIAETICSLTPQADYVDGGAATTFAVTAAKRLRLTSITITLRTTTAALPWGTLRLRVNPTGAAVIGSALVFVVSVAGNAAAIGNADKVVVPLPEGIELSGTQQFAVTFENNVATNVTDICVNGIEYTP